VKLIVEKEREIKNFKPEESWKIFVELSYGTSKFKAEFHKVSGKVKKLKSRADVEKILATLYDTLDSIKE
jgi:DNA topoisomerase-1